jgi:hypothetical protein
LDLARKLESQKSRSAASNSCTSKPPVVNPSRRPLQSTVDLRQLPGPVEGDRAAVTPPVTKAKDGRS